MEESREAAADVVGEEMVKLCQELRVGGGLGRRGYNRVGPICLQKIQDRDMVRWDMCRVDTGHMDHGIGKIHARSTAYLRSLCCEPATILVC